MIFRIRAEPALSTDSSLTYASVGCTPVYCANLFQDRKVFEMSKLAKEQNSIPGGCAFSRVQSHLVFLIDLLIGGSRIAGSMRDVLHDTLYM